jgi:hypothetical protein
MLYVLVSILHVPTWKSLKDVRANVFNLNKFLRMCVCVYVCTEEEWGSSHNALHLIIIHNYDFPRTFGEKLLKYIAILAPYISFFQRYVFIFVLFGNLTKLFLTCLVQELFFSYVNYAL